MKWITKVIYVNIDTGEIIKKHLINNYTILKKIKHATIKQNTGVMEYTIECQTSRQYTIDYK